MYTVLVVATLFSAFISVNASTLAEVVRVPEPLCLGAPCNAPEAKIESDTLYAASLASLESILPARSPPTPNPTSSDEELHSYSDIIKSRVWDGNADYRRVMTSRFWDGNADYQRQHRRSPTHRVPSSRFWKRQVTLSSTIPNTGSAVAAEI